MSGRLVITIISTIAEEAAILIVGVWLLPRAGIHIPVPLIPVVMLLWLAWSVFTYRKGTKALDNKPVGGLVSMIGMRGTTVKPLQPSGLVRIHGELWKSTSLTGRIDIGIDVTVVRQEGLRLFVRPDSHDLATSSPVNYGDND